MPATPQCLLEYLNQILAAGHAAATATVQRSPGAKQSGAGIRGHRDFRRAYAVRSCRPVLPIPSGLHETTSPPPQEHPLTKRAGRCGHYSGVVLKLQVGREVEVRHRPDAGEGLHVSTGHGSSGERDIATSPFFMSILLNILSSFASRLNRSSSSNNNNSPSNLFSRFRVRHRIGLTSPRSRSVCRWKTAPCRHPQRTQLSAAPRLSSR